MHTAQWHLYILFVLSVICIFSNCFQFLFSGSILKMLRTNLFKCVCVRVEQREWHILVMKKDIIKIISTFPWIIFYISVFLKHIYLCLHLCIYLFLHLFIYLYNSACIYLFTSTFIYSCFSTCLLFSTCCLYEPGSQSIDKRSNICSARRTVTIWT